jgi:hypothetical protein
VNAPKTRTRKAAAATAEALVYCPNADCTKRRVAPVDGRPEHVECPRCHNRYTTLGVPVFPYCPNEQCHGQGMWPVPGRPGLLECTRCRGRRPDDPALYRPRGSSGGKERIGGRIESQMIGEENRRFIDDLTEGERRKTAHWVRVLLTEARHARQGVVDSSTWAPEHRDVALELLHSPRPVPVDDLHLAQDPAAVLRVVVDFARANLAEVQGGSVKVTNRKGLKAATDDLIKQLPEENGDTE